MGISGAEERVGVELKLDEGWGTLVDEAVPDLFRTWKNKQS